MNRYQVNHNLVHHDYILYTDNLDHIYHHLPFHSYMKEHNDLLINNLLYLIHILEYYIHNHKNRLLIIIHNKYQHKLQHYNLLHLINIFHSYILINTIHLRSYLNDILNYIYPHNLFHLINILHYNIPYHNDYLVIKTLL